MKWLKNIRWDRFGLVEWVCEHDVGHPDATSAAQEDKRFNWRPGTASIHSCDGCCTREDFPGNLDDS